ncbi:MAG: VanZ family protein, partial [Chromatocurvus sp.]
MRALLAVTALLIMYGSVYPFNFSAYTYTPERLAQLVNFSLERALDGNAIANVILFLPWGVFTVGASRRDGRTHLGALAFISLLGFIVAYAAQFAQVFIAGRVPSGIDVVWNILGGGLGIAAGLALIDRVRLPLSAGPIPVPLFLVAGWLGYQWLPFVPTLDLGLLKDNVQALLANRVPAPFWVFQNTLLWLICLQLFERYGPPLQRYWYPLGMLAVLAIGALLMGSTVNVDDIAGAACALVLWSLLGTRWYPGWQALLLAAAIVGASYLPLQWRDSPGSFSWVPFSGALSSNVVLNVIATWKKLVLYGLLIWL